MQRTRITARVDVSESVRHQDGREQAEMGDRPVTVTCGVMKFSVGRLVCVRVPVQCVLRREQTGAAVDVNDIELTDAERSEITCDFTRIAQ